MKNWRDGIFQSRGWVWVVLVAGILGCGGASVAWAGGEPRRYFQQVTLADLDADAPKGVYIKSVEKGGFADDAGLEAGDEILAINGYRVLDVYEYNYVQGFVTKQRETDISLVVRRNGKLRKVESQLMPVRRVGYSLASPWSDWEKKLKALGVRVNPAAPGYAERIGIRAALALDAWLAEDPKNKDNVDWLQSFADLHWLMIERRFDEVKPIQQEIPIPHLRAIAELWVSIAARRAAGQPPAPEAHGVTRHFYIMTYPLPRATPPPLGDLKLTDRRLLVGLKIRQKRPWELEAASDEEMKKHDEPTDFRDFGSGNQVVDAYMSQVKKALLDQYSHGGWPFRYSGNDFNMTKKQDRRMMIDELVKFVRVDPDNAPIYLYALAALQAAENNGRQVVDAIKQLRKLSPYLAYRATKTAYWSAAMYASGNTGRALVKYANAEPFPLWPDAPEMTYILGRSRAVQAVAPVMIELPHGMGRIYKPEYFAAALAREAPLKEATAQLDRDIQAADFADRRDELFDRLEQLAYGYVLPEDYERLARLNRDRQATGRAIACFNRMAYGSIHWPVRRSSNLTIQFSRFADEAMNKHVVRGLMCDRPDQTEHGYPAVHRLTANLPDDAKAARKQLLAAYYRHGTPAATDLIVTALAERGFDDDAARIEREMRMAVDFAFYRSASAANWFGHHIGELAACYSPTRNFADIGLNIGNDITHYGPYKRGGDIHLHVARAALQLDQPDRAAEQLLKSKRASKQARQVRKLYIYDGKVHQDTAEYRTWLTDQILSAPKLDKTWREKLQATGWASKK